MPIQRINFEGRTPRFTWATKPAANSVAPGTVINIPQFSYSDWYSDGTYWRPKGGQATLLVQDLTMFSYASTALGTPAGYSSPVFPWSELMAVPGFEIDTILTVARDAPASTQAYTAAAQIAGVANLAYTTTTNLNTLISLAGMGNYGGAGLYEAPRSGVYKMISYTESNVAKPADSAVDIRLATGGAGETMYPKILQIVYRA